MITFLIVLGAIAVYIGMASLTYAIFFASLQRQWPTLADRDYHCDRRAAAIWGALWPASFWLAVADFLVRKHGLKWR